MKKRKGFTLIELLAVIVILAIIALIAVPVIMNVINKANKSAFKDTAYGIISAGELYFAEQQLELNGMSGEKTFTFPTEEIEIKGNVPEGTVLKVNTKGETALAMTNGRYCVTKGYTDRDIIITEEFTDCNIQSGETGPKTLANLATTTSEVTSIDSCATNGTECAPGTTFAIKVNDTDTYKFRVLNDENNVVTLIMSSNLYEEGKDNQNVAWYDLAICEIYEEDYDGDGVIDESMGERWEECTADNSKGPLTALKALKERTTNWINIAEYSYTLEDSEGVYADYSGEYVQNVRARLPRLSDLSEFESEDWIYEGLYSTGDDNKYAYWLSDASSFEPGTARYVDCSGFVSAEYVDHETFSGVRPVITLTK